MLAEQLACTGHCSRCEEYSVKAAKPLPLPGEAFIPEKAFFLAAIQGESAGARARGRSC